jgi:hypothetical protein
MQDGKSGTMFPGLWNQLSRPFDANEVRSLNKGGKRIYYATARTYANRMDEVLGPENWWDEYAEGKDGVICKLSVRMPDGRVVSKVDVGGSAGMTDQGDDEKSAYSDAFKRGCAKWGCGRYLWGDGAPNHQETATPAEAAIAEVNAILETRVADEPEHVQREAEPIPAEPIDVEAAAREMWKWARKFKDKWNEVGVQKLWPVPVVNHEAHLFNHLLNWLIEGKTVDAPPKRDVKSVAMTLAPVWVNHKDAFEQEALWWIHNVRYEQIVAMSEKKESSQGTRNGGS